MASTCLRPLPLFWALFEVGMYLCSCCLMFEYFIFYCIRDFAVFLSLQFVSLGACARRTAEDTA